MLVHPALPEGDHVGGIRSDPVLALIPHAHHPVVGQEEQRGGGNGSEQDLPVDEQDERRKRSQRHLHADEARQIEAARIAMTRYIKRGGRIWIRIFPDKPFTKKPAEVRMGKGKGSPEGWEAVIRPGRILYEMQGVSRDLAKARSSSIIRILIIAPNP